MKRGPGEHQASGVSLPGLRSLSRLHREVLTPPKTEVQEFCVSKLLTMCVAIALLSSTAGLKKVDAKGGTFSLQGPWPSTSAPNNSADAGAIAGYEAKSVLLRRQFAGTSEAIVSGRWR